VEAAAGSEEPEDSILEVQIREKQAGEVLVALWLEGV